MWQKSCITKTYEGGDVIVREGDAGKEMFIIQSGSVDVLKEVGNKKITLHTLERGDFFGEMALLEKAPRSATVIARETTQIMVLNIGSFLTRIRKDPTFAFNVMQRMSNRIRVLSERLLGETDVKKLERAELDISVAETEYTKRNDS